MVVVKISSAGCEPLIIDLENDENMLEHFLLNNKTSNAWRFLMQILSGGYINDRPEWSKEQIQEDLHITIPSINLQYILEQEKDMVVELPAEEPNLSEKQPKKRGFARWSHGATLRLIFFWKERKHRFENNTERNEEVWEDLAAAMAAEGYLDVSASQCENKFKYLKRTYTDTKDVNKRSTGQPEKTCPYYEELDEIFKKSPQIEPVSLASSIDGPMNENIQNSSDEQPQPPTQGAKATETTRKKTRLESCLTKYGDRIEQKADEREAARQKRHEELIQLQRESNELYKEMMLKLLEKM